MRRCLLIFFILITCAYAAHAQPPTAVAADLLGRWQCVLIEVVTPTGSTQEPVPQAQQDQLSLQSDSAFVQLFLQEQRGGRWHFSAAAQQLTLTDTEGNRVQLQLISLGQRSMVLGHARYDNGHDEPQSIRLHYIRLD